MSGYAKVHRRIYREMRLVDKTFADMTEAAIYAWLVVEAAWRPTVVRTTHGQVELQRGEVLISERDIAALWGIPRSKVRRFLARTTECGLLRPQLNQRQNHNPTTIVIVNYEQDQSSNDDADRNENHRRDQTQTTSRTATKPDPRPLHNIAEESKEVQEAQEEGKRVPRTRTRPGAQGDVAQPSLLPTAEIVDLPTTDEPRRAMEMWNATAERLDLPCVSLKSSTRTYRQNRSALADILAEHGLDGWQSILDRIQNNPWNLGQNPSGWKCNLAYLLNPKNIAKLGFGGGQPAPTKSAPDRSYLYEPNGSMTARILGRTPPLGADDCRGPIIDHHQFEEAV